jgi:hypothetical protein
MLKLLLLAGALATVTTMSASAQQPQVPPAQTETDLMGLPVYSSDGQKLGEITQVGNADGQMAVRAEMGEFLGIGSKSVIIPAEVYEQKGDRIELTMTAEEVRKRLSRQ